ncbi:MAG: tRNA (N(6)-L-threonylcarbamoyladenosine(37)-C(2))-methylthiotransferase MtaB [Clostridia bacterium]|nr:tRNA (N(6)-L-threonylcarbamoyladenosine(37)-C(2))-methylthiotransferase MtaB [Clostridia bacterium]
MKAAFYTLGCKVNQYETQLMAEHLQRAGYEIVDCSEKADVYVINSCTVTAVSNQKTRQTLRAFKRKYPDCITVLAGCMSQAYPLEAKALSEADIVIGNTEHKQLAALIEKKAARQERIFDICPHEPKEAFESGSISAFSGKTRAEVKIEDGCNRFCSYCAIPYARGRVRSKPIAVLKEEIKTLAQKGYKEVVLVGINLSAYRDGDADIAAAVLTCAAVSGIERVRLGSLEPDHITDDIIRRLQSCEKFCPQFHISLQSGCDTTLKAMNRHYTAAEYAALCRKLRACWDDCTLTTDVMVGFPGESEADFEHSLAFVKRIAFEKVHVFPYSVREGTKAAAMPGQLSKALKAQRAKKMIACTEAIRKDFFTSQIGKEYEVLFETKKGNVQTGHTKNYIPIEVHTDTPLQNQMHKVKITAANTERCVGELA